MNAARLLAAIGATLVATAAVAQVPARTALVVGNAAYRDAPLRNPVNDARAVAATLKQLGFTVAVRENLSLAQMRSALRGFVLETRASDVRLVYFAGHGLQLRGRNYLLPVDVVLKNEDDILARTADATELVEQLSGIEKGANLVIIDACRVHPVFNTRKMWAAKPGLSELSAPSGTLVAFSTRPGKVARDGDGATSVYTRHFTRALEEAPSLPVEALFKRVRTGVVAETQNAQVPWESSDITGELCFRSEPGGGCRRAQ
jgi:carboxyl-terminal processing protease